MNDVDKQKIDDFVSHLLMNPNIKNEPLLIGEGMLLNFIVQNMQQLKATFQTPQFFPHLSWNETLTAIINNLYERVVRDILPVFTDFIEGEDFEFMNKLTKSNTFPSTFHKEKLTGFISEMIKNKDVRYNLNSVVNIFRYNIIEKYINEIFSRRDFLYNELVRVQKTYLETEEYISFLKVLLIIKNAAYIKIPINPESDDRKVNLNDCINSPANLKSFLKILVDNMKKQLPNFTERSIKLAIKANMWEKQTKLEDASSRFLFILTKRFHDYKPLEKIDRGAESPDKSWFSVARKNAEYYGFNGRMLDELYRISGDNNW